MKEAVAEIADLEQQVDGVVKLNPDLEEAKRLARAQDDDVSVTFRALDEARNLSDYDRRIRFKEPRLLGGGLDTKA